MPPGLHRTLTPLGPLALCALVGFGLANPVLGIVGIALAPAIAKTAGDLAVNLAATHVSSGWSSCCRSLFAGTVTSDQPLTDAMRAAFLDAIDRVEQNTLSQAQSRWPFRKPSSTPEVHAYFDSLRREAKNAFDNLQGEEQTVLDELERGPNHAWELVNGFFVEAEAGHEDLRQYVIPIVRKNLPTELAKAFNQQIWSDNAQGTAAWRQFLDRAIADLHDTQLITAQQVTQAIAGLPDAIVQQMALSHEERDRQVDDYFTALHRQLDDIPAQTADLVVERLRSLYAEQQEETPRVQSRFWHVPHPWSRFFIGRDRDIARIRERFAVHDGPVALVQAIQGLGGVGKTQLAAHFAFSESGTYDGVWWLEAETPTSLASGYVALARRLELPAVVTGDQEVMIDAVRTYLEDTAAPSERWLLIFDNAVTSHNSSQDGNSLARYLPSRGQCDVLITSREKAWPTSRELDVNVLDIDDAVRFLKMRTDDSDEFSARMLAEALGRLPLALEQAGAYIKQRHGLVTLASYLDQFKRSPLKRLTRDKVEASSYHDVVATTWFISFEQVERIAPAAGDLLRLCAFLAPEPIPLHVLIAHSDLLPDRLATALSDPDDAVDTVRWLLHYSLADTTSSETITVHRLVQLVVREWMTNEETQIWSLAAVKVVNAGFPVDAHATENWSTADALILHGLAVAEHSEALDVEDATTGQLLNSVGLYLSEHDQHQQARTTFERALAICTVVYAADHPDMATLLNNFGTVLRAQGDLAGARIYIEQALAILTAVYGSDHPDMAASLNNLGSVLRAQGDLAGARNHFEQALAILTAVYGSDHHEMAASLNNLGNVLRVQGDLGGAQEHHNQALAIWTAVYGSDHPQVARSLNNLGIVLQDQGDLAGARNHFEQALAILTAVYGSDHPQVATSLNNLGNVLQAQGDLAGAHEHHKQALAIRTAVYGSNHPQVAASLNNLGNVLHAEGDLAGAREHHEQALVMWTAVYRSDHPDMATLLNNLGTVLLAQGDFAGAQEHHEQALAIRTAVYGPNHAQVAMSLNNLVDVLRALGELARSREDWSRARTCFQQALRFARRLGSDARTQELLGLITTLNRDEQSNRKRRSKSKMRSK